MQHLRTFLAFISFILFVTGSAGAEQAPGMKVGVIAPLSGNVAAWGTDIRNVLLFAKEKLGAGHIDFVFEDDQCLGKNAVTAAHKLLDIDRIDYGISVCTESTLSAAPIFEKAKKILMAPAASGHSISQAGEYIFRTWPSDDEAARLLFETIKAKYRSLGTITEDRAYAQEVLSAFTTASSGSPLKVVSEVFSSGETDFRSLLLRLRARRVEALFLNANSEGTSVKLLQQMKQLNWSVPVYGIYFPGNPAFLELAKELSEGIVFVDAPSAARTFDESGKQLYTEFVAKFGPMQSSTFVFPSAYETLRLMAGFAPGSNTERDQLLYGKFTGLFGAYSFDSNGDVVGIKHEMKVIRNGAPVPIEPIL